MQPYERCISCNKRWSFSFYFAYASCYNITFFVRGDFYRGVKCDCCEVAVSQRVSPFQPALKIHFNINLPPRPKFSKYFLLLRFPTKIS